MLYRFRIKHATALSFAVTAAMSVAAGAIGLDDDAPERTRQPQAEAGAFARTEATRVWHVSPEALPGLPAAVQVRTISAAAAKAEPGDIVLIHSGTYREAVTVDKSGTKEKPIRFVAAPGENVVLTGADLVTAWKKEPGADGVFSLRGRAASSAGTSRARIRTMTSIE